MVLAATTIAAASPLPAAPQAADVESALLSTPVQGIVDSFYARNGNPRIWIGPGAASDGAKELLVRLRTSDLDGFPQGPMLVRELESALQRAADGDWAAAERAERMLSAAWLLYVQALSAPPRDVIFGDPSLVPRSATANEILGNAARAPSLVDHVRRVSDINPFYAELRRAASGNSLPAAERARVKANLERLRILPSGGRFILVDLAAQRLSMVESGRVVDSMKVIVGKPDLATPLIASRISAATVNPYWNVPPDLARKNIAARVREQGVGFLGDRGYELLSGWHEGAVPVDPQAVDWNAVADGRAEVRVRQKPGPGNMMGEVKFAFPNGRGIYLHDTPDRSLFDKDRRTFSSGCVRLEDAKRLGRWMFGQELRAPSDSPELQLPLPEPIPVYLTYLTVRPDGTALAFVDDIYGLDRTGSGQHLAAR